MFTDIILYVVSRESIQSILPDFTGIRTVTDLEHVVVALVH